MDLFERVQKNILSEIEEEKVDIEDLESEILWKLINEFGFKILAEKIADEQGWRDRLEM